MIKYENEVREILENIIASTELLKGVTAQTDLRTVGVNSLAFIKLIVSIEAKFNIEFPEEQLSVSQTGTIEKICKIIASFD
ncbi:phosphopantetheine-binding protein [Clostridium cellulovorans]|uniref:Phosphopantetheine-binding n=1 Tax=Clostridium cellulovorans (strain ATCC 35296 / DSM 3052 / OCM 3 / 743B) TaxID=573061 RepID=D9SU67_CLOC7|nr:phosphopantetheine-binding protein [Clostridium cellulovorans]ADL52822.1 phosphopantetheine-binding [Clostridium cellulovorans 743B]